MCPLIKRFAYFAHYTTKKQESPTLFSKILFVGDGGFVEFLLYSFSDFELMVVAVLAN